jgi:hypothetical protein
MGMAGLVVALALSRSLPADLGIQHPRSRLSVISRQCGKRRGDRDCALFSKCKRLRSAWFRALGNNARRTIGKPDRPARIPSAVGAAAVRRLGLLKALARRTGIYLGVWHGSYLRDCGPGPVLVMAPTRSGKGVGVVVPTLLTWPHSTLVHDLKGENWQLTAGARRAMGHICLKFDPTDASGASVKYNPLEQVRLRSVHEAEDVQNIVHMIIDPDGKVVLATQSLSEIASSPYRDVILESCPTKLYLPNAEARNPQTRELYQKFGLTERQIDIIAEAAPKRDYYYVSPLGRRLFQFALGPAALAFVGAGSKDDVLTARRRLPNTAIIGGWSGYALAVWANGRTTSPHISRRARRGRRP